jgi:serine O-acetyltransferase
MDYRLKEYNDVARAESQWDLHRIVLQWRTLRGEWRQNTKPDGLSYELPSQEAPSDVLEGLSAALFPRHSGPPSLTGEGVDYYIGSKRDGAMQSLLEQVRRVLKLASGLPDNGSARREEQAIKITRDFARIRQKCWAAAAGRGVTWPLRSRSIRTRS